MKPSARNFRTKYIQGKPPASQLMKMKNLMKLQVFYFDFCWCNSMFHYGDFSVALQAIKNSECRQSLENAVPSMLSNLLPRFPLISAFNMAILKSCSFFLVNRMAGWIELICWVKSSNNGSYSATIVSSTYLPRMWSHICMFEWFWFHTIPC